MVLNYYNNRPMATAKINYYQLEKLHDLPIDSRLANELPFFHSTSGFEKNLTRHAWENYFFLK